MRQLTTTAGIILSLLLHSIVILAQDVPSAPNNFIAVADTTTFTITLSWSDNSDNETRFVILKEWSDEFFNNTTIEVQANQTSYVDHNIQPNTRYDYSIWAVNDDGSSGSADLSATASIPVPPVPLRVTAVTGPLTSIKITFIDVSDQETGYQVQHMWHGAKLEFDRAEDVAGGATDSLVTYFINDGPFTPDPAASYYPPNIQVDVRVRAFTIHNGRRVYGPFSPVVFAVTNPVPESPSYFTADEIRTTDSVLVTWVNESDHAASFLVCRYKGTFNPYALTFFKLPADANSLYDVVDDASLPYQFSYRYRIVALDLYEDQVYPQEYCWQLMNDKNRYKETPIYANLPQLNAPILLDAYATGSQEFQVKFIDTNTTHRHAYQVWYSTNPGALEGGSDLTEYTHHGDTITFQVNTWYDPNTLIYLVVYPVVVNPDGNIWAMGDPSAMMSVTTFGIPVAPSDFAAIPEVNHIKLSWTDHSLPGNPNDEAAWLIQRSINNGATFTETYRISANTTTYLDEDVVAGVTYTYALQAVDLTGTSYEVFYTTAVLESISAPQAKLASFVSGTAFKANWSAVAGSDHYLLDVYNLRDHKYLYQNFHVTDTTVEITGTRSSRRYSYVVRAVMGDVSSANSDTILVTHIKNLILHTVCSDDPANNRRWQIINNNIVPVKVWWHVANTNQSGIVIATPGDTFFETTTVPNVINKVTIVFYDDHLESHTSLKSATWKSCPDPSGERDATPDVMTTTSELNFSVTIFPNPVGDKFTLIVNSAEDGDADIMIVSLQGTTMLKQKAPVNTPVNVACGSFANELYILKVIQHNRQQVVKIIKQSDR